MRLPYHKDDPCLVDMEALRIPPFREGARGLFERLTWIINKNAYVPRKRAIFRNIRRVIPAIRTCQYDMAGMMGVRARIAFDNYHDCAFADHKETLEVNYRQCLGAMLEECAGRTAFSCVDIGANSGIVAAITMAEFQARIPPDRLKLRYVAIEPQGALIERLAANLTWNAGGADVRLYHCALGGDFGTASLAINANSRGKTRVSGASLLHEKVRMAPLMDIVERSGLERIDLLKIDVEGFEYDILQPFFEACPESLRPKFLFSEVNRKDERLMALFSRCGYEVVWADHEDAYLRLRAAEPVGAGVA
jgi:FkbM family methyltransferase